MACMSGGWLIHDSKCIPCPLLPNKWDKWQVNQVNTNISQATVCHTFANLPLIKASYIVNSHLKIGIFFISPLNEKKWRIVGILKLSLGDKTEGKLGHILRWGWEKIPSESLIVWLYNFNNVNHVHFNWP